MQVKLDDLPTSGDAHYLHSVLRERIVEHVFVGELLRALWCRGVVDVEVLRSEFDRGGYDLVVGLRDVVRHVQFKTTVVGGRTANVKISRALSEKPSGCVLWIIVTSELKFAQYLWFGSAPGERLPSLGDFRIAKHTKANALGVKLERPNLRVVPRGRFELLDGMDEVLKRLFGPLSLADASRHTLEAGNK